MKSIKELAAVMYAAHDAFREAEKEQSSERSIEMWKFEDELKTRLAAKYGERIKAASEAYYAAKWAYEDAKVAEAERGKGPIKPGLRVVEWKDVAGSWSRTRNWKPTGKVGVVEVFKPGSAWPENRCKPSPGSLIVRVLKKDGTPGTIGVEFRMFEDSLPWGWHPEGHNPNTKA